MESRRLFLPRTGDRAASLTGLRAVAALLIMGTHAAYGTGQLANGYLGALYARLEIGVPIFFVLSGFLLFRPWVRAAAARDTATVAEPLHISSPAAYRACLCRRGSGRLRAVPIPRRRAQSRAHLEGSAGASHPDADLRAGLLLRDASGIDPDLESGSRIRLLCGAAVVGRAAADGALQGGLATGTAACGPWWPGRDHPGVAVAATRWPTGCPVRQACGCRPICSTSSEEWCWRCCMSSARGCG